MKLPFSYKQHAFGYILVGSFVAHVAFMGAGSFFSPSPEYAVEQGPSSMEVVILKDRTVKEEAKPVPENVISVQDPIDQKSEVVKEKKEEQKKERLEKSIYIPPVKGAVTEARPAHLKNPAPIYPQYAREQGWEGVSVLSVLVGADGKVDQIKIDRSSGYKILDESALKTIKTWQFLPARVGSMSFSSWIKIPVRFVLTEDRS